jgi:hypothetical protein
MNRFRQLWDYLRSSFWFLPSLMVAGSFVLAGALIEMNSDGIDEWFAQWPRLFGAGAEGARGMMSTVANETMLTIDRLFPGRLGQGPIDDDDQPAILPLPGRYSKSVPAIGEGRNDSHMGTIIANRRLGTGDEGNSNDEKHGSTRWTE